MARARAQDSEGAFAAEVAALIEADPAVGAIAALAGPLPERRMSADFDGLAKVRWR